MGLKTRIVFHRCRHPFRAAMDGDDVDVMDAWSRGLVPHVQPEKPVMSRGTQWPKVPAGHDRLQDLMNMWLAGLCSESKDALREFLFLGALWVEFSGFPW